jgi:ABC-2 type transport system permease protein
MKSKKCCFNKTIFKKNISLYWPLWAGYQCLLILMLPVMIWMQTSNIERYTIDASDKIYQQMNVMRYTIDAAMSPIMFFVAAVLMTMAVFSYLYSPKSANALHALPVNRKELFVTNYLSGLSFLLIPLVITFLISVLVCISNQLNYTQYLLGWLLMSAGMSFFAYSMAVFVAMFTGQIFALPIYYFILNMLYAGCRCLLNCMVEVIGYGVVNNFKIGKSFILSPLYYLEEYVEVGCLYAENTEIPYGLRMCGANLVAIYAVAAVGFIIAAYLLYKRRNIESAGDLVSIGIVKPVFRWGVAMCGGMALALFVDIMLEEYHLVNSRAVLYVAALVCGFLCFFLAEMLLQKSFKVWQKQRIVEWGAFACVSVILIGLFDFDAFGIERYLPKEDEIAAAFVYMVYPVEVPEEEFSDLLAIHQDIIDNRDFYEEYEKKEENYYYTTIRYYLKDGTTVERRYALPIAEEYLSDADSPASRFQEWEARPENFSRYILGYDWENVQYYAGSVECVNNEGNSYDYTLSAEETNKLVDAIVADIEAGNFTPYYTGFGTDDYDAYYNSISIYYTGVYAELWDYYYNYFAYADLQEADGGENTEMENTTSGNTAAATVTYASDSVSVETYGKYINFGPQCVNVLEALDEMGIFDDEWKLMTLSEYNEIMNY